MLCSTYSFVFNAVHFFFNQPLVAVDFLFVVFLLRQNEVTLSAFVNFKKIFFSVYCLQGQILFFNS